MKLRRIPVVYKKLSKVWGYGNCNPIELDYRLKGKKFIEILVHEVFHSLFPELTEEEIVKKSIIAANTLWHEGVRRVDNDTSTPLQDGKK